MAYSNSSSDYLIPNIPLATTTAGVMREMDIGAASADHGEMLCVEACRVKYIRFTCVGELAGGTCTAPNVVFTKRPTPLSDTAESVIGTLIIPDATAVGATIELEVDVGLAVGDSVQISHVVGSGTPTGIGLWSMKLDSSPESTANNSEQSTSA